MKTAIDLMVNHCKTKFYGVSAIDVGGPTLLGKAVMRSQENFHKVFTNGQVNHIESKDLNIKEETLKSFGYDLNKLTGFLLDLDKDQKIAFIPLAWNFYDEIKTRIKNKRDNNNDIFIKYFPNLIIDK